MIVKWIAKVNWGKVLLVGLVNTVVATFVHFVEAYSMMSYYQLPQHAGVWSKLMMGTGNAPPPEFFIATTISHFATGMFLALIYYYLKDHLPTGFWKRATYFADLMIATSFVFFTLPALTLFNLPYALIGSWFVAQFIIILATSIFIVKVVGK